MSEGWGTLPLLPLRCVLDHLSLEDALAALSTCRHWRSTILMYEGHKDTLKLRVKHLEKNLFVTRLFRKYTRNLHVYIDNCGEDLEDFMNFVLPQFFDSHKLQELVFIGPTYIHHQNAPIAKINRIITESLIFKNAHCLQKLILMGCEMATVKNENDRYLHKNVEYYSRPLSFNAVSSQADAVLTSSNAGLMMFSTLQHIMFDFDLMSTSTLETLSQLSQVSQLTLTIGSRRPAALPRVDWRLASRGLRVVLNIISVSQNILEEIVDVVLVEGMPLISLKVLFCKTLHAGVLQSVVRHHKASLRELVWADAPHHSADLFRRHIDQRLSEEFAMCNVNPLMLLCWQCTQLQRLVIHGYWVWQYDLIGFVRLRASLRALDVSAVYARRGRGGDDGVARVLERDAPRAPDQDLVREVNRYTEFKWSPQPRARLHAALRAHAAPAQRADYVRRELLRAPPAPLHAAHAP